MPIPLIGGILSGLGGLFGGLFGGGGGSSLSKLLPQILGGGLGLGGSLLQGNALKDYMELMKSLAGDQQARTIWGQQKSDSVLGPTQEALQSMVSSGGFTDPALSEFLFKLRGTTDQINPAINFALGNPLPQIQQAMQSLQGTAGGLQPSIDTAQAIFGGGGWSADAQRALEAFRNLGEGNDPTVRGLQGASAQLLGNGGMTPGLTQGLDTVQQILGRGGRTVESGAGMNAALRMLTNPREMQVNRPDVLAPMFFDRPETLSLDQVSSMARDEAASQAAQRAQSFRREAELRGGGPGAVVGAGSKNDVMADFADQAMRHEADSVRKALMEQQGLNADVALRTNQLNQASYLPYQAANLQADLATQQNRLGARELAIKEALGGGQLLAGLSDMERQRLATALGGLTDITGASTQRMGLGGQLGNTALQAMLGGLQGSMDPMKLMQSRELGAGNLLAQLAQLQGGLNNQAGNLFLGGADTATRALLGGFNSTLQGYSPELQFFFQGPQNQLEALRQLGNQGSNYLGFSSSAMSSIPQFFNPQAFTQSPFGNWLKELGQGISTSKP